MEMSANRKKRQRISSLNLESVMLNSNSDGSSSDTELNTLLGLQTTLASTDLRTFVERHKFSEEFVLLWIVSRIGFLNAKTLLKCTARVPDALLTHRRKFILEEVQGLVDATLDSSEAYIDLMLSFCPNACQYNSTVAKQRYALNNYVILVTYFLYCRYLVPPTTSCITCARSLTLHHEPVRVKCFTLSGLHSGIKLSLRCRNCKLNYNYSQYGNKELGYRFYSKPREFVEASDVAYVDRDLCSLFTSFA